MSEQTSHGLAKIVGRNTAFGVVANLAQIGSRLITVPIVIHYLGLDGYGIWNIIMATAAYMRFGSVGLKTAFQKYVAEATGNGNYSLAEQLLSTGAIFMFLVSVIGLIPTALCSRVIAIHSGVPAGFLTSATHAISLLAIIFLTSNAGAAFEAIVLGAQRVDLHRKFGTVLCLAEAVGIIGVLYSGYGIAAMAAVMGFSELTFITGCWIIGRRVVPQIRVRVKSFRWAALPEIFRFAGSYQLVNLIDVLAALVIPVAILKTCGANAAGVYAVATKITSTVTSFQFPFLVPLLSASAMVFAANSRERIKSLLLSAFKVTLGITLFPLGFIAVFGPRIAFAWTAQNDPAFAPAFWLTSAAAFFASFSLLSLVLYRATGNVKLDNVRQLLRLPLLLVVLALAPRLGFAGVLAGMALCEFLGMLLVLYALRKTFDAFRSAIMLPGLMRIAVAALLVLLIGISATMIPVPLEYPPRIMAALKLLEAAIPCLLVAWPILLGTRSVSKSERRAVYDSLPFRRRVTVAEHSS